MHGQSVDEKLNPDTLRFLREKFGDEISLRFVERFAGRVFCFHTLSSRTQANGGCEIIDAFGPDVLDTIFEEYKKVLFVVPTARKFRYAFYKRQGLGSAAIAPLIGVSVRHAYYLGSEYKKRRAAKLQKWKLEAER